MPQIEQIDTYLSQIFWLSLCFGILYWTMVRYLLPRMSSILGARAHQISSDLKRAGDDKVKADDIIASHEYSMAVARFQGSSILQEAHREGAASFQERIKTFEAEAEEKIGTMEKRLSAQYQSAADAVPQMAAPLADKIVLRLTGETVDESQLQRYIEQALAELEEDHV